MEVEFGAGDLARLRGLVEGEGLRAGIGKQRLEDLVLAVNEIATNALVHGGAPARLRVWRGEELVYDAARALPTRWPVS